MLPSTPNLSLDDDSFSSRIQQQLTLLFFHSSPLCSVSGEPQTALKPFLDAHSDIFEYGVSPAHLPLPSRDRAFAAPPPPRRAVVVRLRPGYAPERAYARRVALFLERRLQRAQAAAVASAAGEGRCAESATAPPLPSAEVRGFADISEVGWRVPMPLCVRRMHARTQRAPRCGNGNGNGAGNGWSAGVSWSSETLGAALRQFLLAHSSAFELVPSHGGRVFVKLRPGARAQDGFLAPQQALPPLVPPHQQAAALLAAQRGAAPSAAAEDSRVWEMGSSPSSGDAPGPSSAPAEAEEDDDDDEGEMGTSGLGFRDLGDSFDYTTGGAGDSHVEQGSEPQQAPAVPAAALAASQAGQQLLPAAGPPAVGASAAPQSPLPPPPPPRWLTPAAQPGAAEDIHPLLALLGATGTAGGATAAAPPLGQLQPPAFLQQHQQQHHQQPGRALPMPAFLSSAPQTPAPPAVDARHSGTGLVGGGGAAEPWDPSLPPWLQQPPAPATPTHYSASEPSPDEMLLMMGVTAGAPAAAQPRVPPASPPAAAAALQQNGQQQGRAPAGAAAPPDGDASEESLDALDLGNAPRQPRTASGKSLPRPNGGDRGAAAQPVPFVPAGGRSGRSPSPAASPSSSSSPGPSRALATRGGGPSRFFPPPAASHLANPGAPIAELRQADTLSIRADLNWLRGLSSPLQAAAANGGRPRLALPPPGGYAPRGPASNGSSDGFCSTSAVRFPGGFLGLEVVESQSGAVKLLVLATDTRALVIGCGRMIRMHHCFSTHFLRLFFFSAENCYGWTPCGWRVSRAGLLTAAALLYLLSLHTPPRRWEDLLRHENRKFVRDLLLDPTVAKARILFYLMTANPRPVSFCFTTNPHNRSHNRNTEKPRFSFDAPNLHRWGPTSAGRPWASSTTPSAPAVPRWASPRGSTSARPPRTAPRRPPVSPAAAAARACWRTQRGPSKRSSASGRGSARRSTTGACPPCAARAASEASRSSRPAPCFARGWPPCSRGGRTSFRCCAAPSPGR